MILFIGVSLASCALFTMTHAIALYSHEIGSEGRLCKAMNASVFSFISNCNFGIFSSTVRFFSFSVPHPPTFFY